ncbi:MAG: hypothetical protein KGJ90_04195 [Patescibacteria group bacterium]|nr:hypothetical protein [Patescibacteria group bacterium]
MLEKIRKWLAEKPEEKGDTSKMAIITTEDEADVWAEDETITSANILEQEINLRKKEEDDSTNQ